MHRSKVRVMKALATAFVLLLINSPVVLAQLPAPEVKRVTVATGADIALTAVIVVGLEKGYFAAEGLDVDWRMFPSGAAASQTLATGEVPFGLMAETPAISLRSNGVPVVMLASVSDLAEGEVLWVGSDLNVKKPQDLHGLKIAYRSGSTGDLQINLLVKHYDLDIRKIQLVNLSPDDAVTAYASKQVDGVVAWEPYLFAASLKRPTTLLHTGRTSHFAGNQGAKVTVAPAYGILLAREEFVRKNPNTTMAFMRALVKAQEFIDNPQNVDELVRVAGTRMAQREDYIRASLARFQLRLKLDPVLEKDLQTVGEFMKQAGRLKTSLSEFLCVRHRMTSRRNYATQDEDGRCDRDGVAVDSQGVD